MQNIMRGKVVFRKGILIILVILPKILVKKIAFWEKYFSNYNK